jgi:UDP-N-acetylglucosamine acyltransferase
LIHQSAQIDAAARVDPAAHIDADVRIGPWCSVAADVSIGARTRLDAHVVVHGGTRLGCDNHLHAFSSIGGAPQDKKYAGEATLLEIGNRNVIREYCTFNRGTAQGGGVTRIGSDNWIMAYVHVAHDCQIGSEIIMANGTTLAGHVEVADQVIFGAFTVLHQFCLVGAHAFTAMGTVILKDVPPYVTVSGNSAQPHGINIEGLKRRGYSAEAIQALRRAYKTLYKQGHTKRAALEQLREQSTAAPQVALLVDFLERSSRGIVR